MTVIIFQVLVTVPLALLQKNAIQFNPPLSEKKIKAINSLGAGVIEKVSNFRFHFLFIETLATLSLLLLVCISQDLLCIYFYLYTVAQKSKMLSGITCISVS